MAAESGPPSPLLAGKDGCRKRTPQSTFGRQRWPPKVDPQSTFGRQRWPPKRTPQSTFGRQRWPPKADPPVYFWQVKMAAESGPPSPLLAGKDGRRKRTPQSTYGIVRWQKLLGVRFRRPSLLAKSGLYSPVSETAITSTLD